LNGKTTGTRESDEQSPLKPTTERNKLEWDLSNRIPCGRGEVKKGRKQNEQGNTKGREGEMQGKFWD